MFWASVLCRVLPCLVSWWFDIVLLYMLQQGRRHLGRNIARDPSCRKRRKAKTLSVKARRRNLLLATKVHGLTNHTWQNPIPLVCPVWPTQPWYAQLLQLVVSSRQPQVSWEDHRVKSTHMWTTKPFCLPVGGYQATPLSKRLIRTSFKHCPHCPENSESVHVLLGKVGGLVW